MLDTMHGGSASYMQNQWKTFLQNLTSSGRNLAEIEIDHSMLVPVYHLGNEQNRKKNENDWMTSFLVEICISRKNLSL